MRACKTRRPHAVPSVSFELGGLSLPDWKKKRQCIDAVIARCLHVVHIHEICHVVFLSLNDRSRMYALTRFIRDFVSRLERLINFR